MTPRSLSRNVTDSVTSHRLCHVTARRTRCLAVSTGGPKFTQSEKTRTPPRGWRICRYGEAPAAAASYTTAAGSGGRRAPFSTETVTHTHTAWSVACPLLTLSTLVLCIYGNSIGFGSYIFITPFHRRHDHSPTAFSGPMARPPPSPPRPPPSHIHAGWMVSATRTPTCSAPSQDYLFPLYM